MQRTTKVSNKTNKGIDWHLACILGYIFSAIALIMVIIGIVLYSLGDSIIAKNLANFDIGYPIVCLGIVLIIIGAIGLIVCTVFAIMGQIKTKKQR